MMNFTMYVNWLLKIKNKIKKLWKIIAKMF